MLLIYFLCGVFLSAATYLVSNRKATYIFTGIFIAVQVGLVITESLVPFGKQLEFFEQDRISLVFLVITAMVGGFSFIHYIFYAENRKEKDETVRLHNSMLILFLMFASGIFLSDHFGVLWVFLEGTTVTGAVMIYHDRGKLVLEAVWKYLFVCSFGIALAFAGILFLTLGIQDTEGVELTVSGIKEIAGTMDPLWLKACFLFVVTGFSVKLGVVPMFNVDIDAKDVSPSPSGALFSSVLLNAGFIAIFRFYSAFSDTELIPWMNHILLIAGVLSVVFAAAFMLRVKNYKRMFAYSSMEHAGLALIALTLGPKGIFIAILHLFFHSLIKAGLFFQVGQVHRVFNSKLDGEVGGYFFENPAGGIVLLFSFFAVTAFPPSGLFFSEYLLFKGLFSADLMWVGIILMLFIIVILLAMGKVFMRLLFLKGKSTPRIKELHQVSPWESATQFIGLVLVYLLGIHIPEPLFHWLQGITI